MPGSVGRSIEPAPCREERISMDVRPLPNGELVVFSHLRWTWVWQRPQHLISRLAERYTRTVFVEEPLSTPDVSEPRLCTERCGSVTRIWLEVPGGHAHCGFDDPRAASYGTMLAAHLGPCERRTGWLYTPMALPHTAELDLTTVAF